MQSHYDAVIVGAGLCGALMAEALASAGLNILVLEAGANYSSRSDYLKNFYSSNYNERGMPESPYPIYPQAPFPRSIAANEYYVQTGPQSEWFQATYLRMVGGTTLHWLGTALRMHPHDFKLKTHYAVGKDWPLSYDELESWYGKAEHALGVSGNSQINYSSPRTQAFPMPEIPMSYLGKTIQHKLTHETFDDYPLIVTPTPQARNSVNGYQNRPACSGNHSCIPICPIQAKYEALVHIKKAEAKGAIIQPESVVSHLDVDQIGNISSLRYLRWDGSQHQVTAKVYIIAAHGIETPKLLLNSRNSRFPNGVANSSDQVGRNLMDHPSQLSYALSKEPTYPLRSPLSTSGIESLIDGPFRNKRSAFRMQISDTGWAWPTNSPYGLVEELIQKGLFGEALNKAIENQVTRQVSFVSLMEMLPNPANRVALSEKYDQLGIPRPQLRFKLDDYVRAGFARARSLHEFIFNKLESTEIKHFSDEQWASSSHIMGTTVMGDDPKTSVVDKNLRSHDHPNLYILGSSVFPSSACVNPSLTITALTLKVTQPIIDSIRQSTYNHSH